MEANEYQALAMRTANHECLDLSNLGLGLTSEAGKCANFIKKHLHHGHELSKDKLLHGLGDVLWYVALGCQVLDVPMSDVMKMNLTKLQDRYPDGFDKEISKSVSGGERYE